MAALPPPAPGWRDRSQVVDGNALAGPLASLFALDPTGLIALCGACRTEAPLAEAVVEVDDAAFIGRCRTCTHTLLVVQTDAAGAVLRVESLAALRAAD